MFSRGGRHTVVCCASPHLERPTATIGLGDTFLAGTLLILGGQEPAERPPL
jgi:ADP-dependent phosphofructokinase/glucokinase